MLEQLTIHHASTDTIKAGLAIRDTWLLVLGFFGLLRRSELRAIRLSDITSTPSRSHVHLRPGVAKGDTKQTGYIVPLP